MPYVLNECITGVALFKVESENRKCDRIAKYEFINGDSMVENIKLLRDHKYSDEIVDFLKCHLNGQSDEEKEILHITDKNLIPFLKEKGIKAIHSPDTFFQFKDYLNKKTKFSFSTEETLKFTKYVANALSCDTIQSNKDTLIIQSVKLFDYLEKEINMHCMRIKEFYGMHFPELADLINDNEKYLRMVVEIGDKDGLTTKYNEEDRKAKRVKLDNEYSPEIAKMLTENHEKIIEYFNKKLPEVQKAASTSVGSPLSPLDISEIHSDALIVLGEMEHRTELSKYINNILNEIAPNALILVGQNTLCKLIIKAGSLKDLSQMPSSTLQVLGAEKALFSSLRSSIPNQPVKTPKYGILFHTPLVSNTVSPYRGRMARMVAAKLAICLRADYFSNHKRSDNRTECNKNKLETAKQEQYNAQQEISEKNNSQKEKTNVDRDSGDEMREQNTKQNINACSDKKLSDQKNDEKTRENDISYLGIRFYKALDKKRLQLNGNNSSKRKNVKIERRNRK